MTPLLLLAEKVEGLSGPDREVDAEIAALLRVGTEHEWALRYPAWIAAKDGRVHLEKNGPGFAAPAFTASLDAAMSLVPENADSAGERFRLETYNSPGVLAPHVRASAWVAGAARVYAATPALALVAAALRARHHA